MGFFAVFGPVRTEACQVELADLLADMLFRAVGAERTEAFFVVWAGWETGRGVDVEVETFIYRHQYLADFTSEEMA